VMLLSSSLSDQLATVALVKRRLLYATVVALSIAVLLGFVVAAIHARRLGRLQTAADRIAEGAFDEPIVDDADDEVGQLAASFDRMRIQLAQLDQARREFVANASHELRTPLFSLAGFLELLDDEDLDESTRHEFLATTRSQVERLTKLATDLLDLSRLDVGRMRIERDEVGLAEVARVVAEDFFVLADASRHTLLLQVDDDAWAHADEERVQQITRALIGNALTHTPAGTTVQLRVERRGPRVALVVEDDGPGIPPEHLERIFQRFYRIEGGQASGSGLGLAIARELAGLMGGTVTVASRPGATTFTLELPTESPPLRVAEALPG
jgi:two-component system, OmpR family, sensor kinase